MPHRLLVEVRREDIDELGHASNLVYLRWVLEAALAHSTAVGLDQAAYLSRGEVWVVRRHEVEYVRPAMAGEQLAVDTRVVSMGAANSVRRTAITRVSDGALLCRASTDWVFVDVARGRPRRIPEDVRARFPIEPD
ncbi:MAG TPA: thioesterase family protein [Myxococcales bacterium]|nr:thioesterase family protein [Myxococcales bacterium]